MITEGGASHGGFYLAQDSHRLYIGNEDGTLSPVNEGITTISSLSQVNFSGNAAKAAAGRFYYLTENGANILCVWNGQELIQINPDTNDYLKEFTFTIKDSALIQSTATVKNKSNQTVGTPMKSYFKVNGGTGVSVTYANTDVTIDGSTVSVPTITVNADYELSLNDNRTTGNVEIKLDSDSSTNASTIPIVTGGGLHASISANDELELSSDNTKIPANGFTNSNAANGGFTLSIQQKNGSANDGAAVTTTVDPVIQYGDTPISAHFVNGIAQLDVYTKDEIEELKKLFDSMHYRGTISLAGAPAANKGSCVDALSYNASTGITATKNGNTVQLSNGDVLLLCYDGSFTDHTGTIRQVTTGSLFIAEGTEDSDGYITPSTLKFSVVESTADTDTQYVFKELSNGTGIALCDRQSNATHYGELVITGGSKSLISVTKATTAGSGTDNSKITLTVEHEDVTRSDVTEDAISTNVVTSTNWVRETTIPVVEAVTTNSSGHVTGVTTQQVTIRDSATHFPDTQANVTTTSAYNNIGIVNNALKLVGGVGNTAITTSNSNLAVKSDTLSITAATNVPVASGSSTVASGLQIDMIWGSFS